MTMSSQWFFVFIFFTLPKLLYAEVYRFPLKDQTGYLKVEFLQDYLLHAEYVAMDYDLPAWRNKIWMSPMVERTKFSTVKLDSVSDDTLETVRTKIFFDGICLQVFDKKISKELVHICPKNLQEPWKGLSIDSNLKENIYGLGQYFTHPGTTDGDLKGRVWDPLQTPGNSLRSFNGGANGTTMFPILYALGKGKENYAFFLDNTYKQKWNFQEDPWQVSMFGDQIRFFVMLGDDLKSLRSTYMDLTGKPPVPPKSAFGLWVSKFGYENWQQIFLELEELYKYKFPIDGFVMDLQWFGGKFFHNKDDAYSSKMGSLSWDENAFPNAKDVINYLKKVFHVELMTIEESYVSQGLREFEDLSQRNYLAHYCAGNFPVILDENPWWGVGGMIDWTNESAGAYWHDKKRQKLVDLGIRFHWIDLGEPEMYNDKACYAGISELNLYHHYDIHNLYNYKWAESIAKGYDRNQNLKRPFILSRSGTSGIQRYGAGLWSGDIASNMAALTAHLNAQMHISLSGIDYYGSDVGGFHRNRDTLDGDENELYTQWLANSSLFDFPVRPHVWSYGHSKETSPAKIGDRKSNLYNIRRRYQLLPYYYSLAHQASQTGEALVAPMATYFQENLTLRDVGHQKMIGPFVMAAVVARYGEEKRNVYLPKGTWFEFHSQKLYEGNENWHSDIPTMQDGLFRLPLFIREGGLVPTYVMKSDTKHTEDFFAHTENENPKIELWVMPSLDESSFTVVEDDGDTPQYKEGKKVNTKIWQKDSKESFHLVVEGAQGNYNGFKKERSWILKIIRKNEEIKNVFYDGLKISKCVDDSALTPCFKVTDRFIEVILLHQPESKEKEIFIEKS